jgi:hypothetical protein
MTRSRASETGGNAFGERFLLFRRGLLIFHTPNPTHISGVQTCFSPQGFIPQLSGFQRTPVLRTEREKNAEDNAGCRIKTAADKDSAVFSSVSCFF